MYLCDIILFLHVMTSPNSSVCVLKQTDDLFSYFFTLSCLDLLLILKPIIYNIYVRGVLGQLCSTVFS